ncbi:MAG TPA: glycosyltransferase [Methylibium sp.]|uniref:glycosyltransferase n=1 Tax=Methylibium sp. TaxID=2067992 RepID=UPI002DB9049D|nr:glycosyltransferase [Methylibium sp.]HEU4460288.1 glycosyltransferase [Methylibium sp.]
MLNFSSRSALPVLVFSHLPWNFVYQRPQHLLSRIAARHRVVFVEEPRHEAGCAPRLERLAEVAPGVTVLQPVTGLAERGFTRAQMALITPLVVRLRDEERWPAHIAWMYTPMAVPALARLDPAVVVYDCMDELSAFKGAAPELPLLERELLRRADLVITGGPSLYEAKRNLHPNVHCLPSAVDAAHYQRATPPLRKRAAFAEAQRQAEALHETIGRPRLGFFGVIDERLDLALIDALAAAHEDWQVVMVGPVVKLDDVALPRRPNLHWLGQQPYAVLPHLVAGWDACLMPFAINEHTRYISPTKTLEYLAAGKPVISTPVRDVVDMYRGVVSVAPDAPRFIAACAHALQQDEASRLAHRARAQAVVARHGWQAAAALALAWLETACDRADALSRIEPAPTLGFTAGVRSAGSSA